MKLLAAFCCAATCALLYFGGRAHASSGARPPARLDSLELCSSGGVELVDERCTKLGACAKQSVRLTWARGEGTLFEGDPTGEKELSRLEAHELRELLGHLSALQPRVTDFDLVSGELGAPPAERALTITTDCGSGGHTFTFLRSRPTWSRVRTDCQWYEGAALAECAATSAWHAAFATTLAARFDTVFSHLRERARHRSTDRRTE